MTKEDEIKIELPRHLSVKDAALNFRWALGGLRWAIFNAKSNGLEKALRRVGRKVLIDRIEFEAWIDSQGGGK